MRSIVLGEERRTAAAAAAAGVARSAAFDSPEVRRTRIHCGE